MTFPLSLTTLKDFWKLIVIPLAKKAKINNVLTQGDAWDLIREIRSELTDAANKAGIERQEKARASVNAWKTR